VASHLDGTWQEDFAEGDLRKDFEKMKSQFSRVPGTDEEARTLIEQLIQFYEHVEKEYNAQQSKK